MNRIAIVLDENGEVTALAADEPVEFFFVDPNAPADRVYQYSAAEFGPQHVRKHIGGYAVGHIADGTANLVEGDGTGRRQPSVPHIREVPHD